MPRDGSNVYSQPAGTAAGPAGTTISSANFNTLVADLVTDANLARPIVAGGTGATNAAAALANIGGPSLSAIAGLTTSGLIVRTGSGTAAARSLATGGANITITNADGVAGNPTVALTPGPLTEIGGLTPVQGDLLYRNATVVTRLAKGTAGQALRMNAGGTEPEWADELPQSATVATGLGSAFDITGIPAWARRVSVIFYGVSLSGSEHLLVRLGTSGGIDATGYSAGSSGYNSSVVSVTAPDGFPVFAGGAGVAITGVMTIVKLPGANTWIESHAVYGAGPNASGGGSKILSGTLDRVRITRSGADNFDGGSVTIMWE